MKALHDLVQTGKVRYIGASSMWTWQFQHYNNVAEVRYKLSPSLSRPLILLRRKMGGQRSCLCKISTR
jgi:aryl-alcohol dehydrogenase-like predicted oxidoreductase